MTISSRVLSTVSSSSSTRRGEGLVVVVVVVVVVEVVVIVVVVVVVVAVDAVVISIVQKGVVETRLGRVRCARVFSWRRFHQGRVVDVGSGAGVTGEREKDVAPF